MRFLNFFKKQNLIIKVGFISLAISIIVLLLSLILISTANFTAQDPSKLSDTSLQGNGWSIIGKFGIDTLLTSSGYKDAHDQYNVINTFTSAPLAQLVAGIVFLIILLPVFGGIAILALLIGYFKRWLYT